MEFKILYCEEPTLNCFCNELKKEGLGDLTSIEESRGTRNDSIVMGKVIKVISSSTENRNITISVKEVLPNCEYGQKFKAVVHKELALALIRFAPEIGDRLAFYEPIIFVNPAFVDDDNKTVRNPPKYLLEIGGENQCMMWAAKKQWLKIPAQGTSTNRTRSILENLSPSNKNSGSKNGFNKSAINNNQAGVINHSKNVCGEKDNPPATSPTLVQTRTSNTQPSNPYKYKSLSDIKSSALSGNFERVNLFAVVHQIPKELTKTVNSKFTKICKIIDESLGNRNFDLHFFVADDILIKQIKIGDVLRLHRVKMELFNDDVDGRIFSNNDIVLLKERDMDCPLHFTKNLQFSEAEKKRAENLMKWYKKFLESQMNTTLLADVVEEGRYNIFCQVVSEPVLEGTKVVLRVADGTVLTGLLPSRFPPEVVSLPSNMVTEIHVLERNAAYATIKVGSYVIFPDVKASEFDALRLLINTPSTYQILDEQNEKVADIKRRISELERKTENHGDTIVADNTEVNKSPVKTKHNNQAASNNSLDDEMGRPNVSGNCKKSNGTEERQSKFSPCGNKSCMRPKAIKNGPKRGKDIKGTESDAVTAVGKRRALFNASSIDLSDAATEASEVLEPLRNDKTPLDEVVVNQANTSFGDLLQLVRTKYCSPRKTSFQNSPKSSPSKESGQQSTNVKTKDKVDVVKRNLQTAVVKLVKLSEEECKSAESASLVRRTTRSRKRTSVQEDNIENASTVINMSYQNNVLHKKEQNNKRVRLLESVSTVLGEDTPEVVPNSIDVGVTQHGGEKVCEWLFHPNNKLEVKGKSDLEVEELDSVMAKLLLLGKDQDSPDLTKCLTSMKKRLRLFLVEVIPEPQADDLDLVSGYCCSGCRQIFLFSKIHWQTVDKKNIPLCPDCIQTQQEKQLELMFMFELHVFDVNGLHATILVCREHAENLLRCSVREYVKDRELRRSRVRLLTDYSVKNTLAARVTPLLDVTVTIMGKVLLLIDTKLKLPC